MALEEDINGLGFANSSIAGLSDTGFLVAKKGSGNSQFITVARRQNMHEDGKGKKKDLWFQAYMDRFYNLNGSQAPYWYSQNMYQYTATDYTKTCKIDGIAVPAGFSAVSFWAQSRKINGYKELERGEYIPVSTPKINPDTGEQHVLQLHQNQADKFELHHDNENFEHEHDAA